MDLDLDFEPFDDDTMEDTCLEESFPLEEEVDQYDLVTKSPIFAEMEKVAGTETMNRAWDIFTEKKIRDFEIGLQGSGEDMKTKVSAQTGSGLVWCAFSSA